MNNQWLNDLQRKMEDHEEDIPDGLWEDIKDKLFTEEENGIAGGLMLGTDDNKEGEIGSVRRGRSLLYRFGGIAAAIALLFFMGKFLLEKDNGNVKPQITNRSKIDEEIKEINKKIEDPVKIETNVNDQIKTESNEIYSRNKNILKEQTNIDKFLKNVLGSEINANNLMSKSASKEKTLKLLTKEDLDVHISSSADEGPTLKNKKEIEDIFNDYKNELPEKYADHKKPKLPGRQSKKWMLSMLTGNVSSNSSEQKFPGYTSISGSPMAFSDMWMSGTESNPLTELLLANQSKEVEARIRHKIPVTLGISTYYNFGKRWGVGTGVNYTKLTSELHSGSNSNYIKGEQSVHYIGIPVQVNYNVVQKGRFTGYVTGGVLAEKAIAGKLTTKYIVNDEVTETQEERLDVKSMQFSVNSAVGLQVKIIDKIGIYAEPGIGYHFKNDNQLNTIYKEKPLNFNMKFGIRLLLD